MMLRSLTLLALVTAVVLFACSRPSGPAPSPTIASASASTVRDRALPPVSETPKPVEIGLSAPESSRVQGQDGKGTVRLGVVNLKTCFEKYDRIKKIDDELKLLGEDLAKELKQLEKDLENEAQRMQALSREQPLYWEKLGKYKLMENEIKFKKEFDRQRYLNRYAELQISVYNDIRKAVSQIGAGKFDLILRVDEPTLRDDDPRSVAERISTRVVLFNEGGLDITDEVIKKLNAEWLANEEWDCPACHKKAKGPTCACGAKKP